MSKGQRLRRLQQAVKPATGGKEGDKSTSDSDSSREDGKEVCAAITTGFYFGKVEQPDVEQKKIFSKKKKTPWSQTESPARPVPMAPIKTEPTPESDDYWYYDNGSRGYFYGNAGGMGWRRLRIGSLKVAKEDSGISSPGTCSPPISEEGIPDIGRLTVESETKAVEKAPLEDTLEFVWKSSWDKPLSQTATADEDALAEKIKQSAFFWK